MDLTIALQEDEASLLREIDFESLDHDHLRRSTRAAKSLTMSLLNRGAVPRVRLDWMTDPELNVGVNRSRFDVFESNGTHGEAIFEHGNFLKYLRYWIFGPNLSPVTVAKIQDAIDCMDTEGGRLDRLCRTARSEVRAHGLDARSSGDEFFKLILELDGDRDLGRTVRDSVRQVKRR